MPRFTRGELAVMRLLWKHGEMKPSQIQRLFPEPIKNPALRSYLTILFNKGHVGRRKARHILDTGADAVFTGNVGCLLQIGRYLRAEKPNLWVAHPIDALWASYSGTLPPGVRARHSI